MTTKEQARAEVARLAETELKMFTELTGQRAEAEAITARAAETVLDGADLSDAIGQAARAKAAIELHERAIEAARRRRLDAIRAAYRTEAAELRQQAVPKRAEAEAIDRKTAPLLAKLAEIEGVPYTAAVLSAERDYKAPLGDIRPICHVPRSAALRAEAADLEKRAAEIEHRDPLTFQHAGQATGATLAELAAAVLKEPMAAGAPLSDVARWYNDVTAQRGDAREPGRYELHWRGGKVDRQSSILRGAQNRVYVAR